MDENYKNIFLKNLRTILKRKGIKMSVFEQEIGVSKGYFSRLDSKDSNASPRIDTLMKAVENLGYSIDTLLTEDLSSMDNDKIKVVEKIKKIIELIESDKIECNYISAKSYVDNIIDDDLESSNLDVEDYQFYSFFSEHASLVEEGFIYFYYKDKEYHIYNVRYEEPDDFSGVAFEFYVLMNNESRKICNGTPYNGLYMLMFRLYEAAKNNSSRFRIDQDVLNVLDDF